MGGQYGASLSASSTQTSASNIDSPLDVTGGGGSLSSTLGNQSPTTGTGTPSGFSAYLPWIMGALCVVALGAVILFRK
jgi:hypothetical protein